MGPTRTFSSLCCSLWTLQLIFLAIVNNIFLLLLVFLFQKACFFGSEVPMCQCLCSFAWPAFGLITLSFNSNKTVLKIYQCFGELITSSAVFMKIEVAILSFSTNVRMVVSQNYVHTQKSWEGLQAYGYQARWPLIAILFMWQAGAVRPPLTGHCQCLQTLFMRKTCLSYK